MKRNTNVLYILGVCILMSFSCERVQNSFTDEVYIIGLDPCTAEYPTGTPKKGYVVQFAKNNNMAITYNLPLEKATQVDLSNSIFPLEEGYLFPEASRKIFKLNINYRYAKENEKVYPLCGANIDLSGISKVTNQLIINETNQL